MKIALITDPRRTDYPEAIQRAYHRTLRHVIESIAFAIRGLGHTYMHIEANDALLDEIAGFRPDLIFNRSNQRSEETGLASTPHLLHRLGIPFTGPNARNCVVAFDKAKTKNILRKMGLRTANFITFNTPDQVQRPEGLHFPLIVKPVQGGCSVGIEDENLIHTDKSLQRVCTYLIENYQRPVIVETFIAGREFTVGILGNQHPEVLPILEYTHPSGNPYHFRSFHNKMHSAKLEKKTCPANLTEKEEGKVSDLALNAYHAIGCRDYARIDMRFDHQHIPHVLEVNAFPSLIPDGSSFTHMAAVQGLSFKALINRILRTAVRRNQRLVDPLARTVKSQVEINKEIR